MSSFLLEVTIPFLSYSRRRRRREKLTCYDPTKSLLMNELSKEKHVENI